MPAYKITITKKEATYEKRRLWQKMRDCQPTGDMPEYGYVDDSWEVEREHTILDQRVDALDVIRVIKAINGID
jgi:hypothetical protein